MKILRRAFFVFIVLTQTMAQADVAVAPSPDWRELSPGDRERLVRSVQGVTLVDCGYYRDEGFASFFAFTITENAPIESFETYRSGTIAGMKKPGLTLISEKDAGGSTIPGRVVLLEGKPQGTHVRALVWTVYSPGHAYLLTFVEKNPKLDADSPLVRSYLARLQFSKPNELSSTRLPSSQEAAWQTGNRLGEIAFGLLLVGLPIGAVILFRVIRRKNEDT
jgi:hypothetical protein